MKKLLFLVVIIMAFSQAVQAQESNIKNQYGNLLFLGGSLSAGFSSGTFAIGANPEIGYSLAEWLDVGLGLNIYYSTLDADYNYGIRQRSFNYGGGPFLRAYPVRFLFIQAQFEENWVHYNLKDEATGQTTEFTTSASSFIGGIGYTQRLIGQGSYYIMVGMDFLRDANSPYLENDKSVIPIVRAGFNFYLKHKKP